MRYFKKLEPRNNPILGNGSACTFTTLDGLTGYFATDNEYVGGELGRLIGEGRYGISEITDAEFVRDYLEPKKNGQTFKPIWREEVANPGASRGAPLMQQLGPERVAAAVGVVAAEPPLRTDGPTEKEYRAAGYKGAYPPSGYAPRAEGQPAVPMPASIAEPEQGAKPQTDIKAQARVGRRPTRSKPQPPQPQS